MVIVKKYSGKFRKIHGRTSAIESFLITVTTMGCSFSKKKVFHRTYFPENQLICRRRVNERLLLQLIITSKKSFFERLQQLNKGLILAKLTIFAKSSIIDIFDRVLITSLQWKNDFFKLKHPSSSD